MTAPKNLPTPVVNADETGVPVPAATETTLAAILANLNATDGGGIAAHVAVDSLPSGLATSARQDTGNTSLAAILARQADGSAHVAVDSLPSGLATSARQDTENATVGQRFAGGKKATAAVISTNGDNTVYTPASGKKLTLFWIGMSSSQANAAEVLVTVKLGTRVIYEWYMGNPGAFSHWEPLVADNANDALIVNLSAGSNSVAVNVHTSEA